MGIRDSFINYNNKLKEIKIKELETSIYIKKWSGLDRAKMIPLVSGIDELEENEKYEKMYSGMAKIIQESALDENGNRAFEDTEEDFKLLENFPGDIIQEVFEEIMAHNGMEKDNIKEAAKN